MRQRSALRAAAFAFLAALPGVAWAQAAVPSAPIVAVSAPSTGTVQWAWNLTDNTTGFRVLSSTGGGNISGDLSVATTFFALTGLSTNTAAAVTIEAFGPGGTADSPLTTAYSAAATPSGSLLLGTNNTAVSLSWQVNGNPAGTTYEVFWSSSGGTPIVFSTTPAVIVAIGSASATVPDLPNGYTITFQVLAVNQQGQQTPFDITLSTYVAPVGGQPMISSGTYALGISSIAWSWSPSTGALNYQLFSATGGAVSPLLPPTQFTYIQTGLTTNTSYLNYITAFSTDSFGVPTSTNSTPFGRYTLAAQTFGLTATGLFNAYENLVWNANGNPSYTSYNVSWWTGVTSTVTYSTTAVNAAAGVLPAGGTVYFTVQAMNGEGILAAYDQTLFTAVPSTYFAVGVTTIPPNFSGVLTFAVPTGPIYLGISSGTFPSQAAVSIITPSVVPAAGGRYTAVPGVPGFPGINFSISAFDPFGNPMQPLLPIQIRIDYVPAATAGFAGQNLVVARYDVPQSAWVPLITQRSGNQELASVTEHLTQFAVLSLSAPTDLSGITVGPNPLRPYLNPGQVFTFRNLPPDTRIRVFSYVGEKLCDVTADASGLASWDGRGKHGGFVGSGVYIAVIEGGGTKKTMRLAIER